MIISILTTLAIAATVPAALVAEPPVDCLALSIARDVSGSVGDFAPVRREDVDSLIDLVGLIGGSAAFLTISEDSFRPTLHSSFHSDTLSLEGETLTGRIRRIQHNRQVKERFATDKKRFVDSLMGRLSAAREAPATDLWGALRRVSLFLSQAQFDGCRRIAILITDSKPTVAGRPPVLPDCQLIVVGSDPELAHAVFGPNCLCFENLTGVVEWLHKELHLRDPSLRVGDAGSTILMNR